MCMDLKVSDYEIIISICDDDPRIKDRIECGTFHDDLVLMIKENKGGMLFPLMRSFMHLFDDLQCERERDIFRIIMRLGDGFDRKIISSICDLIMRKE